jgi:hypothetical protein
LKNPIAGQGIARVPIRILPDTVGSGSNYFQFHGQLNKFCRVVDFHFLKHIDAV